MGKNRILVVEDDADIQQLVSYNLIKAGYNVSCADSGEEALQYLDKEPIDAIVLDLMLPGKDGVEICNIIRSQEKICSIPIVMLTAKSEEDDIVGGLGSGADDYVTKPFSPRVLLARIEAILRRKPAPSTDQATEDQHGIIRLHGMEIHPGRHEVRVNGEKVHLTITEFTILSLLAARPGWVFSRQQIIDHVRGYDYMITPRAVDVQIFGLRKKLEDTGDYIETVRGIGYRMKETD
ncbi:response regulator transcription factor [Desulfogranum japonicum]|uniref:response regulator transcription factor n=1 Tax=Desulfogranum japonicum TaxID=231447 RepID=UPI00041065CA|nr:response regulator transcription factor [Desulfogranum japonicum]